MAPHEQTVSVGVARDRGPGRRREARPDRLPDSSPETVLRGLDDQGFADLVVGELRRRSRFAAVADQIDSTLRTASFARVAATLVPHVCAVEAGQILARRGVLTSPSHTDALRAFARDGRLIVLRDERRWVYPRFQLDHFDPRDPENVVGVVNRMLDAAHYPEWAVSWWISPVATSSGPHAPVDLLGVDHPTLRQLAAG